MRENTFASLEIGDFYTKLVIGFFNDEKINILFAKKVLSKGVINGDIVAKSDVIAGVNTLLVEAEKEGFSIDKVVLVLPNKTVNVYRKKASISLSMPNRRPINVDDINALIKGCKTHNILDSHLVVGIEPIRYELDNQDFGIEPPINYNGSSVSLDAFIYTIKNTIATGFRDLLFELGIEIIDIVLNSVACANIMLSKEEIQKGAYIIDVGATSSGIAFFKDGLLNEFKEGKYGGNFITSTLASAFEIDKNEAEYIKVNFAAASLKDVSKIDVYETKTHRVYSEFDIVNVVNNSLNTIISDLEKVFDMLLVNNYDLPCIVVGGTSNIYQIDERFATSLRRNVKVRRKTTFGARNNVYIPLVGAIAYYLRKHKVI
ncbi:MAG: hypothetical protein SO253_05780 [Bacilli bacterium]|nr:hypothetical protein [Bacilli bacterium]